MKYTPRLTPVRRQAAFAALLLFTLATAAAAQTETYEPYILRADQTDVRVWSAGDGTHARVVLTFAMGGFRITEVGPVTRQGNDLSVDFVIDRFTGPVTQGIVVKEFFLDLGALGPGAYTFTVRSRGHVVRVVAFDPAQVGEHWEEASIERVLLGVWTTGGVTFASAELWFPDDGHRVVEWHAPERVGNDFVSRVRLERWTGRASALAFKREKRLFVLGQLPPGESFTFSVQFSDGVRHTTRPFTAAGTSSNAFANPLDDPAFFVRQHYLDFLGREPDPEGLTFWYNELVTNCPFIPSPCMDARRVNVSAAFFLSIEFQRTGFYVYLMHKAATGQMPRMAEFLADTRETAEGVVVGRANWEARLEENQRRFGEEFVARDAFRERYPDALTPAQYVDALYEHAKLTPTAEERAAAVAEFGGAANIANAAARARAHMRVAGSEALHERDVNRAFVMLQYFGYLRRDPHADPDTNLNGYNYWLNKLNQFDGNFIKAEMVKAVITAIEHRSRFGQP